MRFITRRLPDGVEDPAILSADGRQVWPLSWLGLSYETLSDAIPFLTPQVRAGLSLAIAGIPALPIEAVTLESPIPAPAQDVICLGSTSRAPALAVSPLSVRFRPPVWKSPSSRT